MKHGGQEMGIADASYGGCSEGQDRAPQAQEVEQHTGKIRKAPLGRVPSCAWGVQTFICIVRYLSVHTKGSCA